MKEPDHKTIVLLEQCRESARDAITFVLEHAQGDVDLNEAVAFLRGEDDPPDDPWDIILLEILIGFLE